MLSYRLTILSIVTSTPRDQANVCIAKGKASWMPNTAFLKSDCVNIA